ncbi:MAG TPA: NADPH-dependent FMN reductase [Allosphingosinicella sp.]
MPQDRRIAVIVGSLRKESYNLRIARILAELAPPHLKFEFVEIGGLPPYNEDLEQDPPAPWRAFRDTVRPADALLFVTPEYNRSMPGGLKNALDVGSRPYGKSVWEKKPGAVATASQGAIGGFGSNHHLRQSCVFLDVPMMQQPEAYLSSVQKAFAEDGSLTDESLKKLLKRFILAYADWVEKILRGPGEIASDQHPG